MPTPAGQSCWSLVRPLFPDPHRPGLGWAAGASVSREGMAATQTRTVTVEAGRGEGLKIWLRDRIGSLDCDP